MNLNDIEDLGTKLLISIPENKTNKPRSFIVNDAYLHLYRKYVASRPPNYDSSRFFFKYRDGRGYRQVVGVHQFGKMPEIVASYLNLPNPSDYTGHCFRRSSATMLVDAGANLTCLKRHGGWKSSSVAESYIDDSITNKVDVANKILRAPTPQPSSSSEDRSNCDTVSSPELNNISDCTVTCESDTMNNTNNTNVAHFSGNSFPALFKNCTNCHITVNITNNNNK